MRIKKRECFEIMESMNNPEREKEKDKNYRSCDKFQDMVDERKKKFFARVG